jgi:hypothetical protein
VKSPHRTVLIANHQDRSARGFASDERARIRECYRGAERSVRTSQHSLHLRLEALRRAVIRDWLAPQRIADVRGAVRDVRQDALGNFMIGE